MAKIVLLASLVALAYIYAGYPLVLQLLVWTRGARRVRRGDALPRVSLVISAYNEGAVIAGKLRNALEIDYPAELFEIVVVSDESTDDTDAIVTSCGDPRVRLHRQVPRRGKTAGLNAVLPTLRGEIVVFSDANAMYQPDSVRKLVRNFADPEVGFVTGEARYLQGDRSMADVSERAYWNYEIWIKRLETAVGSMVGGDGAIYAIRRALWQPLPEDAINDFLNPLQIVGAGWRGVYEPEAICYEETASGIRREVKRRVRIVSRSWRAVFQAPAVLNPLQVGLFTFCLVSHKVLRWFSGLFLMLLVASALALALPLPAPSLGMALVVAVTGLLFISSGVRRAAGFLLYFAAINLASLTGLVKGTFGKVSGVWTTPRADAVAAGRIFRPGLPILLVAGLALAGAVAALVLDGARLAPMVFWTSLGMLVYIYAGYPLVLRVWSMLSHRRVAAAPCEPTVCLLVAANDEAAVIGRKIENSLSLDYPMSRLAVVIASDGSVDGTNDIVRAWAPRVQLLAFDTRRGKIAAINEAMRTITADIVVLSDANTYLRPDALRSLVQNFADPEVGAVSGDVMLTGERAALAGSEDLYYRYERHLQRLESEIGSLVGVDGALYAIRRELFVAPPPDTILDDMAIPMAVLRAGRRVVFEVDALADEAGSGSSREEFWRKVRVVAGAVQFLLRADSGVPWSRPQAIFTLTSHKALRWLSPAFGALSFGSALVLAPGSLFFGAVLAAECGVLTLGLLGCVPALRRSTVVALPHYFCLVQAAAAVGFVRGLAGRQPVAWRRFARATVQPT
jgi:cellulose synthase/poly-beta-1,6-N-acetylglucosamine synthase-like glycosyltransferase